ncbi:hypothetical protein BpHYR1_042255 [Brachionus plicatilis]|uniref:Uncharacterized protein n=1 Tax=Brachionus plicatilis TaxID=10195 RepID=A0A3M7SPI3_BRAPC|nr:hypothetical protein BpHYR1_042255 [Brachionus plicatilis]
MYSLTSSSPTFSIRKSNEIALTKNESFYNANNFLYKKLKLFRILSFSLCFFIIFSIGAVEDKSSPKHFPFS